ncbi:MAG: hypothetical protein P4L46_20405 [Fimbriimonas sp.]|nr:hypothetical protein [Fimbriimonas sp.]
MGNKPKIAFYWCSSCGGCEESLVDMAEAIVELSTQIEIVLWPVAADFKKKDIEAMADGEIVATMLNGAIRTSEQEEMARLLRRKSQILIAYGSCAYTGGIPGLSNQFPREQLLKYVYHDAPSVVNPEGQDPQTEFHDAGRVATLPIFSEVVRSLDQVVDVDYYIPGCAPNPELVLDAIHALLSGNLPSKGTVLAPDIALCEHCPRLKTKPADIAIDEFKRPHQHLIDPNVCMLVQGFACLGPATRSGCGGACLKANMPCTGCFGPMSNVRDQGAKALCALASIVAGTTNEEIDSALDGIPDPVGTFYRYGLAKSMLRRKVNMEPTLSK